MSILPRFRTSPFVNQTAWWRAQGERKDLAPVVYLAIVVEIAVVVAINAQAKPQPWALTVAVLISAANLCLFWEYCRLSWRILILEAAPWRSAQRQKSMNRNWGDRSQRCPQPMPRLDINLRRTHGARSKRPDRS